jgi:hypothetical protein
MAIEETAAKLLEVSEKARERVKMGDEGYPVITAQNAAAAVERNALKWAGGDATPVRERLCHVALCTAMV